MIVTSERRPENGIGANCSALIDLGDGPRTVLITTAEVVDLEFYERIVRPTFERGGVFYILPDVAPIAETFPEFAKSHDYATQ